MQKKTNLFSIVLLGHLNVKSNNCYKNDTKSYEGTIIDGIKSQFGMELLINEPAHTLPASSFFIDLIFVSQPNFVMELGVHLFFASKVLSSDNIR